MVAVRLKLHFKAYFYRSLNQLEIWDFWTKLLTQIFMSHSSFFPLTTPFLRQITIQPEPA